MIPVVRTLEPDISRVLDIGAFTIQVPQVNTAELARRIVAAAKYPPLGNRGVAFSTPDAGYGFLGGEQHVSVAVWFSSRYARRRPACTRTDRLEGVSQVYHEKPREKPDRREP